MNDIDNTTKKKAQKKRKEKTNTRKKKKIIKMSYIYEQMKCLFILYLRFNNMPKFK